MFRLNLSHEHWDQQDLQIMVLVRHTAMAACKKIQKGSSTHFPSIPSPSGEKDSDAIQCERSTQLEYRKGAPQTTASSSWPIRVRMRSRTQQGFILMKSMDRSYLCNGGTSSFLNVTCRENAQHIIVAASWTRSIIHTYVPSFAFLQRWTRSMDCELLCAATAMQCMCMQMIWPLHCSQKECRLTGGGGWCSVNSGDRYVSQCCPVRVTHLVGWYIHHLGMLAS